MITIHAFMKVNRKKITKSILNYNAPTNLIKINKNYKICLFIALMNVNNQLNLMSNF